MTYKQAPEYLERVIKILEWEHPLELAVAVEKGIEAIQKQIPKKTVCTRTLIRISPNGKLNLCPNCRKAIDFGEYCPNCGQALDWSGEE